MSRITSVNKTISFNSAPLKTPNFKEITTTSYKGTKDATPNPPIIMDEYGLTPDHDYFLARKPPPSFFQVKRKLDLSVGAYPKVENTKAYRSRSKKKPDGGIPEFKGKITAEKPRYDTSLGQLTKKFLKLLSDATDGVINLNQACSLLSVPKRRLYDITNVLEGAGLIQKTSRNNIKWMGRVSSPCASVLKYDLEREIDILEAKENKLDELIYYMKAELEQLKELDSEYHYVTSEDLKGLEDFSQKLLIGVNTSPSVQIEKNEKSLVFTSKCTEIEAFLLRDDISFGNILNPKVMLKEDMYQVKIENNILDANDSESSDDTDFSREKPCLRIIDREDSADFPDLCYNPLCPGTPWSAGDTVIKNAFITEEDDIAPIGRHFLLQTEDQDLDLMPFNLLDSNVDNYSFSLDDGEGLTDLFDCSFPCP